MVRPGKMKTIVVKVVNHYAEDQTLVNILKLPDGWRIIGSKSKLSLPRKGQKVLLLNVLCPKRFPAGKVTANWQIKNGASLEKHSFDIQVEELIDLKIAPIEGPQFALAGSHFEAYFMVVNNGNTDQNIQLEGKHCTLQDAQNAHFVLKPGTTRKIGVEVNTPQDADQVLKMTYRLVGSSQVAQFQGYQHYDLFPTAQSKIDSRFKWPGFFSFSYLGRQQDQLRESAFQGELFLAGKLGPESERYGELKLRGPNQFESSGLGQFDEYYAMYQTPKVEWILGDQSLFVSPLSESARFGRGLQMKYRWSNKTISAFYLKPRFFEAIQNEWGGSMAFHGLKEQLVRFSFLNKQELNATNPTRIGSAFTKWNVGESIQLQSEVSLGSNRFGNTGKSAFAMIDAKPIKNMVLFGQVLWADTSYPGYFQNTLNINARLGYRLTKQLDAELVIQKDDQNIAQDTLFGNAPSVNQRQFRVGYRLSRNLKLSSSITRSVTKDQSPIPRFNVASQFLRFNAIYQRPLFQMSLAGEFGERKDLLVTDQSGLSITRRVIFNSSFVALKRIRANILSMYANQDDFASDGQDQLIFGISLGAKLSSKTEVRGFFQNSYSLRDYYRDRDLFNVQIKQQLFKHHHIEMAFRKALMRNTINAQDMAYSIRYVWELGLPLEPHQPGYEISGRISGLNGQKAILYLDGQAAVTDKSGQFKFTKVSKGVHFLLLDPQSLKLHQITNVPFPIKVSVQDSVPTPTIDFGIIQGASIIGKIEWDESVKQRDQTPISDFGAMILELTHGAQVFRRVAAPDGFFEITNLPPGNWSIKLIHHALGKKIMVAANHQSLQLEEGEEGVVSFALTPKKRTIKFKTFKKAKTKDE